jgi:hypothetical protein
MNAMATHEVRVGVPVRLRLRQEVARVSDGYADAAQQLATEMERAREGTRPRITPTQVRGLENVAYTTDKVSDILDLVKKQIGRERWPADLGQDLLDALGQRQAEARRIAQTVDPKDEDLPRRTHLLLCREFIKHLAAHFVYRRKLRGEAEEER